MIILDTETTGLIKNSLQPLAQQPRIIELAALRLDPVTLREQERFVFRANPGFAIDPEATKGTGITNEMLAGEPPFITNLPILQDFCRGSETLVAHNLPFDRDMLMMELERADALCKFPWPSRHVCTVEATTHLKGHRLRLADLFELATGKKMSEVYTAHVAIDDARALADIVRWLAKEDML